jgi:DNA-binding MarR family transcriptional regulator/GNAT superfamily N-acetyltransferase
MASTPANERVNAVRGFNRFYTKKIGVLQQGWLGSPFSLAEARVLYELAHHDHSGPQAQSAALGWKSGLQAQSAALGWKSTATDLGKALDLDASYLSRMLRSLHQRGFVRRARSNADGRRADLSLTRKGRTVTARLDRETQDDVAAMLAHLTSGDQSRLVAAMHIIEELLSSRHDARSQNDARSQGENRSSNEKLPSYVLRPPHAGDLGWVVHRQGLLYAEEWGYNEHFEAMAAQIVAEFVQRLRPARERCWIAEKDGEIVGSVLLVRKSETVAKLRLLLVEPSARGFGIGSRLIEECVRFARRARYRKITLWTQSELKAARRLYKKAGFTLTAKQPHDSFGRKGLVAETWDLAL